MIPKPTGTKIDALIKKGVPPLPLDECYPNPGKRYGKSEQYAVTLLAMKGDKSFPVDDPAQVYLVAKALGISITTRKKDGKTRVWRVAK